MKCAVLGDPIAHSLSPVLHRAGYAELGLAWTYDAIRLPEGSMAAFVTGLGEQWRGLSVTAPLKREALAIADAVSDRARLAGGANTLIVAVDEGGRFAHADNTDLPGAVSAIRERYDGAVTAATIVGSGATAASTGLAMAELGAREIRVLARSAGRAEETVSAIASHPSAPEVSVAPIDAEVVGEVVVSTIPAAAQSDPLVARVRRGNGGVRGALRPVADPARCGCGRTRAGGGRRVRPAGAPGGAAVPRVHWSAGAARRDAVRR